MIQQVSDDQQQAKERRVVVMIDGKPYRLVRRFVKLGSFVRVEASDDEKRLAVETFEPILTQETT